MMMLISMIIMMKQAKHFPFSKTNICKCSQQTFYLAKRMRETEARQLWVVLGGKGGGVLLVGGEEVSSKQTHNYSYSCVCLSVAVRTANKTSYFNPPPPPVERPHPLGSVAISLALANAFSFPFPFPSYDCRPLTCNCMRK